MRNRFKNIFNRKLLKILLFLVLGGIGGYGYYYFIGCQGGTCPITSNPYISTSYGMLMGLLLGYESRKAKKEENA